MNPSSKIMDPDQVRRAVTRIAHEILGMSLAEIAACNRHAVEASFIPEAERRAVVERYFS